MFLHSIGCFEKMTYKFQNLMPAYHCIWKSWIKPSVKLQGRVRQGFPALYFHWFKQSLVKLLWVNPVSFRLTNSPWWSFFKEANGGTWFRAAGHLDPSSSLSVVKFWLNISRSRVRKRGGQKGSYKHPVNYWKLRILAWLSFKPQSGEPPIELITGFPNRIRND